jgi:hypothetical protein
MLRRHFLKAAANVGTALALISRLGEAKANIRIPSSSLREGSDQPVIARRQIGQSRQLTYADAKMLGQAVAQHSSDNIRADQEVRFLLKRIYGSARKL